MIARGIMLCALSFTLAGCSDEDEPPRVGSWECGPPEPLYVELSTTHHDMCAGSEQRLTAKVQWSCGKAATTGGVFSSSDPVVIAIDGDRAIARARGVAELRAKAEGKESAPMLVRVTPCALDAGTDADASD
jgi:hypothetical protein